MANILCPHCAQRFDTPMFQLNQASLECPKCKRRFDAAPYKEAAEKKAKEFKAAVRKKFGKGQ